MISAKMNNQYICIENGGFEMQKKEKVIVYPFDIEFVPVLRHKQFLDNYDIIGLVAPKGWGLNEEDAGITDYGEQIGIRISNNFNGLLDFCDTVIFTEPYNSIEFEKIIAPKIDEAIKRKKNIVCTLNMEEERCKTIEKACQDQNTYFKYYNCLNNKDIVKKCEVESIHRIETPVIFIMGMCERTHKFEIQLALRENLLKMGYRVSQVGSRSYCEMLGFHSMPNFMYSCSIPEYHKIILFNHYIKSIEVNEAPDVIVIGIPGGVMTFSNEFTNKFGIMAFEISRAVTPDASVLSVLYEDYKPEYFKELYLSLRYKLGAEIDVYNLANVKFDWEMAKQIKSTMFYGVDSKFIDDKKQ